MYLKKIIAGGFKSFADRVTLTLEKNHITGIVGPNGSGKSNVIDAVRWVMGEQNAKMLRGEKATDIIFAGSERRKALGMAEVTLVFDNSEGSPFCPPEYRHEPEVALTRRLFVDGEREYLINRKPARLKDIVSFFTSTGLGGKSYSMIQQGQVDRILQAKPEELREILEEAAGTIIFKQRRQETVKKLETTRLNVSRIEDILREVERQMLALQEQVDKAQRWQGLNLELQEKEISLFAHNFHLFKQKFGQIKQNIDETATKEAAWLADISQFENRYQELKEQLDEADPELHALTEEIAVLREKIASSEASLQSSMQLLQTGQSQLVALHEELQEDEQAFAKTSQQVAEAEAALSGAEEEAERLVTMMEEYQQRLELSEEEAAVFQNKVEGFNEEKRNLERMLDSNKVRRESLERDFSKASRQRAENTERLMALEEEFSQGQILAEGLHIKVKNSQKGLDQELEEKNRLELNAIDRKEKLVDLRDKLNKQRELFVECKAKLSSLQELELMGNDLSLDVQKLREVLAKEADPIACSLLTSVISFERGMGDYPPTLLAAFEKWAERLVVTDQQHLGKLAAKADELGLGGIPASLLTPPPGGLEEIQAWGLSQGLLPLSRLLRIDVPTPGIENLLERLFVAQARVFPKSPFSSVVVFTEDGHTLAGEELILGAQNNGQGALTRKQQMVDLAEKLEQAKQRVEQHQERLEKLEAQDEKERAVLKEIDARIFAKNKEVLQLMSEVQTNEQKLELKREQMIEARRQYNKMDEQCEVYASELDELRQSHTRLEEEKAQTVAELEDARAQAEELRDERAEIQRQFEQQKMDQVSSQTRALTLREHFEQDREHLLGLEVRVKRRREEKDKLLTQFIGAKENQVQLERDIEAFVLQRESLEEKVLEKREANAGLLEELRVVENRMKECRDAMRLAQKAVSEREVELERLRMGMHGVKEQAYEKYRLELEEYSFTVDENFDPTGCARAVGGLRSRLEGLGPVNLMAIDEFKELKERQTFIQSQRDEVVSSMDLLELAIEEIEQTSKTKFLDTFIVLNKEFSELFPILFPRGEGQIQLTDTNNPLESGVEILVRLPGKAQQNMRLFSGGEKALTAIALIFALLKSKPTPFCFLDEVDAPLDETNVGRYNRVLEALSDRFQFIVITHRRGTMEVLDTLYGVTMQEPGVSKVVGVDLAKALPAHLQKAFKEPTPPTPSSIPPTGRQGASART